MRTLRSRGQLYPGKPDERLTLGEASFGERVFGVGSTKPGTSAGKMNAIYAEVDLTNVPDLTNVNVSHRLGTKPSLCELIEVRNSAGPAYATAAPVRKSEWTPTNCRVSVALLSGTAQPGTVLKFRIGGE